MKRIKLIFTLFLSQVSFWTNAQSDWEVTKAIRQIEAANGKVDVESIFPVDSADIKDVHRVIYLDDAFKRRSKVDEQCHYRVNQLMYQENLPMYYFFKNAPDSIQLDSLVLGKAEGSSRNTFFIESGYFMYKEGQKTFRYWIKGGYVQKMTIMKKKKLWSTADFSGLYRTENKMWPVVNDYDKDGILEIISTIIYLNEGTREVLWEAQKK